MAVPIDEVIRTKRCRLRYPDEIDIPHVWSASRVPGFNDGLVWDPPADTSVLTRAMMRDKAEWATGSAYTWTIESIRDGTFIGRHVIRREEIAGAWSIGFWIHPDKQGNGFASEVAPAIIAFGFQCLGAKVIGADHATWNLASGRVLQSAGMNFTGTNPQGLIKKGVPIEVQEYEIRANPAVLP